jgi:prevent-host-death family protein
MASRVNIVEDIQPLTTFRNNSVGFLKQLKRTRRPIVLTVNGKPEAVLQDPAAYQRLLDLAAQADEQEDVRQGLADMREGRTEPLDKVLNDMRVKYGIPR